MTATSGRKFLTLGILNLTPDSFSDGGRFQDPSSAFKRAMTLLENGADYIDVGAESTRPGSSVISEDTEWERLEGFLELACRQNLISKISVDTRKHAIMKRAAEMKVSFINCVGPTPEADELMELVRHNKNLSFIATHMHGTPADMQLSPLAPQSAKKRVSSFFESATADLLEAGFETAQIFMDPGIGFGKTDAANLGLLIQTPKWSNEYNIAIGVSRKGFIGRLFGGAEPSDRDQASKVIEVASVAAGASLIRTHDVLGFFKACSTLREAQS